MREVKFIERPEVLDPCADCGEIVICPQCMLEITTFRNLGTNDREMVIRRRPKGKNWHGEDGDIFA